MDPSSMETADDNHLSTWHKVSYGLGDLAGGGAIAVVNFYYAIFLTDVVVISPFWAMLIILAFHAWTAVVQLYVGHRSDRTPGRFGRRRPYFLYAGWLMLPTFFLLWLPLPIESEIMRVLYATLTALAFYTVFYLLIVPYNALGAEIARGYDERSSLMAIRFVISGLATIACASLPMIVVGHFAPDVRLGYGVMAAGFGLVFTLPWYLIFFVNKEPAPVDTPASPTSKPSVQLSVLLSNRTIRSFIILVTISALTINTVCTVTAYYAKYYLRRPEALPLLLFVLITVQTVGIPIHARLSYRIGKAADFMVGALLCSIGGIALFTMGPETSLVWLLIGFGTTGMGAAAILVVPYSMLGDVADVADLLLGRRLEGLMSGVHMFVANACAALARVMVVLVLGLCGFVSPLRVIVGDSLQVLAQPQPHLVVTATRVLLTLFSVVLLIIGMVFAYRYPLSRAIHARLCAFLNDRREDRADAAVEQWLRERLG